MFARSAFVAFAFATAASVANAATVTNIAGTVSVNRGSGFVAVADGASINPGDRVFVPEGGGVHVAFSSTCVVSIPSGQTFTVPAESPCVPGGGVDPTLLGGGLLVIGGVAVAAVVLTGSDSNRPTRPVSP